jgi:hypothetical protein
MLISRLYCTDPVGFGSIPGICHHKSTEVVVGLRAEALFTMLLCREPSSACPGIVSRCKIPKAAKYSCCGAKTRHAHQIADRESVPPKS